MKFVFNKYEILSLFGVFWLGLEFFGLILAVTGIFYKEFLLAYLFVAGAFFIYIVIRNNAVLKENSKFLILAIVTLLFIALLSFQVTPTVFSGRDQGSFSEAALRLAENHHLAFSFPASEEFFKIYGPGRALNFPGFDYTASGKLVTHFPLGYTTWLAIFYSLFGINGLIAANGTALFLFFMFFFLTARFFLDSFYSGWAWLLALTSFGFSWFFKFTLSENLAVALIWFGIWEFVLFLNKDKKIYLYSSISAFFVLAFSRVEAWAFLVMILTALRIKYGNWNRLSRVLFTKPVAMIAALMLTFLAISVSINFPFYRGFIKGLLGAFLPAENGSALPFYSSLSFAYSIRVFSLYTFANFFALSALGIIYLAKKRKFSTLIPAFVILPAAIYLVNPSITSDHPWLLRRFTFSLLPIAILYSLIFLDRFFSKKIIVLGILFLLLAMNLTVSVFFFPVSENNGLLTQVEKIGQQFNPDDLVLIDKEATGNNWAMMSGPMNFLYGVQAVYFFNPGDLGKINTDRFQNIYLIIPDKNIAFYENSGLTKNLEVKREYDIKNVMLDIKTGKKSELYNSPVNFPVAETITTFGKIYQFKKN